MRVPLTWLHEYCAPDLDAFTLADRLAMTGTEVERVTTRQVVNRSASFIVKSVSGPLRTAADYVFSVRLNGLRNTYGSTSAVRVSARIASFQRSRYTKSFQSGMRLCKGQPVWQNGTPQSMQRAPCSRTFCCGKS